ncbi:MAG TPA: hypothetical protein VFE38_07945 [Edaphobacter sp.]|nr:hypothetical protein [Edaphobacter sp.]
MKKLRVFAVIAAFTVGLMPANATSSKPANTETATTKIIKGHSSLTCELWPGEGIFCCSGDRCGFFGTPSMPSR